MCTERNSQIVSHHAGKFYMVSFCMSRQGWASLCSLLVAGSYSSLDLDYSSTPSGKCTAS